MQPNLIIIILCLLAIPSWGQNIFSEKDFEYSKTLLPYDVSYTIPLADKQFVILREEKKNMMKLGRYDQYFFDNPDHEKPSLESINFEKPGVDKNTF